MTIDGNAISSRPPPGGRSLGEDVASAIPPPPRSPTVTGFWSARDRDVSSLPAPPVSRSVAVRRFGRIVARSAAMHEVFDLLERVAQTDITVALFGETGTGKELFAHALHETSARADGPFVVFDCGAVTASLAESELLGHERGSFTGAQSAHTGAFERAHGGTLFLDEIGELPIDLQPRLLRALESRRVRRVGGRLDRAVDVRVITATHRNLQARISTGRFREDLFFRLAGAVVKIPPLRDRIDELPDLVAALLQDLGRGDLRASEPALAELQKHPWPGNVRELKNVLSYAAAMIDRGSVIGPKHLRMLEVTGAAGTDDSHGLDDLPLGGLSLERVERIAIRQTLAQVGGSKTEAAQILGIAASTLYKKLRQYDL
jgi:DNA-binding NtrC family response regulator